MLESTAISRPICRNQNLNPNLNQSLVLSHQPNVGLAYVFESRGSDKVNHLYLCSLHLENFHHPIQEDCNIINANFAYQVH